MTRAVIIATLLFIAASSSLTAQQLLFKSYTVHDGLVANPVLMTRQDSKGVIWLVTWEGVSKYDGHKFTNFTMSNGLSFNVVNDIHEISDNKFLIAENNHTVDVI